MTHPNDETDRTNSDRRETPVEQPDVVIITGLSGAGRSEAIHTFEDSGYFCIDNLPPSFIRPLVELRELAGDRIHDIAVVCDVRGLDFFEALAGELEALEQAGLVFRVLFLEAEDAALIQRFKATRRPHPLMGAGTLIDGINAERAALAALRGRADMVIDTSQMRPQHLKERIVEDFLSGAHSQRLAITVTSFGFKYGLPIDADLIMDVRFLPNPFYEPKLRSLTGRDTAVRAFVLRQPQTEEFLERWFSLLDLLIPSYRFEGKTNLSIALGCTGGRHRSVVLAGKTTAHLRANGYAVNVGHRDIGKDDELA